MNSATMFWALASSDMPGDRGQQQRVELAVCRLRARRASASASSTAQAPPVIRIRFEHQREVVDRAARPRRSTSSVVPLPDRQAERGAERDQR